MAIQKERFFVWPKESMYTDLMTCDVIKINFTKNICPLPEMLHICKRCSGAYGVVGMLNPP